jgi:hypothetical protein
MILTLSSIISSQKAICISLELAIRFSNGLKTIGFLSRNNGNVLELSHFPVLRFQLTVYTI